MRLIRVMCTGRIDMGHVLRAFSNGTDGVFIGGCRLNECNYVTHGNYQALNLVQLCKKILGHLGLNPERLRMEFMSSGEGNLFAQVVDDFVGTVKELGPLGQGEGVDGDDLDFKLKSLAKLLPYLRLVEGERLRMSFHTVEEYEKFYAGEEFDRLFNELIADKLAISQIISLLKEKPHSPKAISEILGLTNSETARYLNSTVSQGLVRYEASQQHFALV